MAGTLSATVTQVISESRNADFTSTGLLDVASMSPVYAVSAALAGAGSLAATGTASYARSAALAGAGALTAVDTQKYAVTSALTSTGTLSATGTAIIPISVIGTPTSSTTTTVAIPTHAVGDIIILAAARSVNTLPSKPAASGTVPAWTDIDAPAGANVSSMRSAYFKATATNHTSGTWTNASRMCAIVLRGQHASSPIGGHATATAASISNSSTAPAITMTNTSGSSFLIHLHFHNSLSSLGAAPTGYTRQAAAGSASASYLCMNSKNVTTSDGAIAQTDTSIAPDSYQTATIEILRA